MRSEGNVETKKRASTSDVFVITMRTEEARRRAPHLCELRTQGVKSGLQL